MREADQFTYNGPAAMPEHKTNPFAKDRGAIVGAYVIAKTPDGDILTDVIDLADAFGVEASRGPGLWIILVGSAIALAGGITTLAKRRK